MGFSLIDSINVLGGLVLRDRETGTHVLTVSPGGGGSR
jgi:hypothetical protein